MQNCPAAGGGCSHFFNVQILIKGVSAHLLPVSSLISNNCILLEEGSKEVYQTLFGSLHSCIVVKVVKLDFYSKN